MNRRFKAFWAKHEGWLGPMTVVVALVTGWQGGSVTTRAAVTEELTGKFSEIVNAKDARIKELHERAFTGAEALKPAVEAAVQSAQAAAKSAEASADAVKQVVQDTKDVTEKRDRQAP